MGFIALYQLGLIRHLPDPPLPMMNADRVDGSAEAYERFRMPDAVLGFGSYAVTMALAAMGGTRRARETPWIPLALAAKIAFDASNAGKLSVDQWTKHRAFCVCSPLPRRSRRCRWSFPRPWRRRARSRK